jgi:hypothetical protein
MLTQQEGDIIPAGRAWATSKSDRWFTPPDLLAEIDAFLGGIELDPCPPSLPGEQIANGLALSWSNLRVFVNPPYGRAIRAWAVKMATEPVAELVALLPVRAGSGWFRLLMHADAVACMFLEGRLQFSGYGSAPFDSVLVYRGPRRVEFIEAFVHRAYQMPHVEMPPGETAIQPGLFG